MPLRKKLSTHRKRVTTDELAAMINNGFDALQGDVHSLQKDVTTLKKDVANLNTRMNGVEYGIGEMRGSLERVTDNHEGRIKRIERHLDLPQ